MTYLRSVSKACLLLTVTCCCVFSGGPARAQDILAAIVTGNLSNYQQSHEAMAKVLKAGGLDDDKLKLFVQTPNADKMSLVNSLRRAEAAGAKLIVTHGSQATALAAEELKSTPLLFADVYDPVALGVVKTLAAPGTDASGATSKTDMGELIDTLAAIKPLKKVGILYTKGDKGAEQQLAELEEKGKALGFSVEAESVRNPDEARKIGDKLATTADALFLTDSVDVALAARNIIASTKTCNCVIVSQIPGLVEAGALIGMEADPEEQGKLVAVHALQVLQGQKVHILPVREAKKTSLTINQQTASRMGLSIQPAVAAKAKVM